MRPSLMLVVLFFGLLALVSNQSPFRLVQFKGTKNHFDFNYDLIDYRGTNELYRMAALKTNAYIIDDYKEVASAWNENYQGPNSVPQGGWYENNLELQFVSPRLINISSGTFSDGGGAHPNHYLSFQTYGYLNGKPSAIELDDCFKKSVDTWELVKQYALKHHAKDEDVENYIDENGDLRDYIGILVTRKSISVELEGFNDPGLEITLPLSRFRKYLDPRGPLASLLRK